MFLKFKHTELFDKEGQEGSGGKEGRERKGERMERREGKEVEHAVGLSANKGMNGEEGGKDGWKGRRRKMGYIDAKLEYRRNKNRGYRKLRAWRQAIELYVLICEKVKEIPGSPYRLIDQIMDAASSISSNIAEGYCRRSLKEYLYFLNVALGSSGEVYSRCYACFRAGQFSEKTFDEIDALHYESEGDLLRLVESLQKKQQEGEWQDNFILREAEAEYFITESEEE